MRIGSLSNVNLIKWQTSDQRDVFIKSIPGYMMPLSFDLNSSLRTHIIDGMLADTSTTNLATDMEYLESLFRTGQLVWLDATDQYPSMCSFGKIAKLQGPTLDFSMGPFVAKFSMEFWSVPPWGTMLFNPWKQTGFKFRDIDGVGAEYMLDPTQMHCNYTLNEIGQSQPYSVSWEFILENQNPFTNVTSKQYATCDSLGSGTPSATNPIAIDRHSTPSGYGSALDSLSIDTTNFKEGTGSLKGTKSSPAGSAYYGMGYDLDSSGINISSYDRLTVWYRCDQTGQSYEVEIQDVNGNYRQWSFGGIEAANTWERVVVDLSIYSAENTIDLSKIRYILIWVGTGTTPPSEVTIWADDFRFENGYINHCEDTNNWVNNAVSGGQGYSSITNDTVICKNSYLGIGAVTLPSGATAENAPASIKFSGTSGAYGGLVAQYNLPTNYWDFSAYDFLLLWIRSDFGGNTSNNQFQIIMGLNSSNYYEWNYQNVSPNQCYRLAIPLRNPSSMSGNPALNNIGFMVVSQSGAVTTNTNMWIDEIALDVGNYAYVEMMLPDNLVSTQIQISPWDGSQYEIAESFGTNGYASQNSAYNYALDQNALDSIYGTGQSKYMEMYQSAAISSKVKGFVGANGTLSSITYSAVYGTNNRAIFTVKMPPMTSDSISGNYPSNDLIGFQAINKIRFKITVYFPNDDTTYSGFNSP